MLKLRPFDPDGDSQCSVSTQPSSSLVIVLRDGEPVGGWPVGRTSQSPSQKSNSRYRGSCAHGRTIASNASTTAAHPVFARSDVRCASATSADGGTNKPAAAAR